jgi:tryptophan synthase alpha chain
MATQVKPLAESVRARGDIKLIPYLMAGYPDRNASVEIGRGFAAAGAAAIEVGVPYSDPLADGPTIQRAGQLALDRGMDLAGALQVAAEVAMEGVPVVMMTYVNPVLAYDARRFAADASAAGVAGVIVPDLPVEESVPTAGWFRAAGLDTIFLVAPTSTETRIEAACQASSGFVYCVTLTGVTGTRTELAAGLEELTSRVRRHTDLPVAAGFGISRPEHLGQLRGRADAAVIASALIEEVHQGRDPVALFDILVAACR